MRSLLVFTLTFIFTLPAYADISSVQATVDKNPAMLDEAVRLTVVAEGDADRDAFDSTALLKDFVVGRTSVSSQTSVVNFDMTRTTTWTTTLFPRNTGTFTIPSFTIEGKSSEPIELNVIPVSDSDGGEARDYFVDTEVAQKSVFLQQQIYYTARLYLATNIERGSLQAPTMPNADIRQLGEDNQYTDIKNGKRYQVIERRFAIVPQASGEFTIRGPVFSGEVLGADPGQRFGFFNRTREVNRIGPDIVINVNPIPDDVNGHWLPSELVRLDEEWPKGETYRVGEPVTRVLSLTAIGVVEEQLPELPTFYPPSFKLYPDQASTATVEKDKNLIAQRQESLALIPTKPGDFVLPEVTVPWFNVITQEVEYATLPARTITVAPATGSTSTPAASPSPTETVTKQAENAGNAPASQPDEPASKAVNTTESGLSVLGLSALLLVCVVGWIGTVFYYRRKLASAATDTIPTSGNITRNGDEKQAFDNLQSALKQRDEAAAARSLRIWLTQLTGNAAAAASPADWPETRALQPYLNQLQASRFGTSDKATTVDWPRFNQALQDARNAWFGKTSHRDFDLKSLYPDNVSL